MSDYSTRDWKPEHTHPPSKNAPSALSLRLQRRLEGIHRCEDHAEESSGKRGKSRLDELWECTHELVAFEQGKDTCVGSCVAKASYGSLHECGPEALVVTEETAVDIEGIYGFCGGSAEAVLIIHDCTYGLLIVNGGACSLETERTIRVSTWSTIARGVDEL